MLSVNTVKMRNQFELYSIFPGAFQKDLSLEGSSVSTLDNDVKRAVKTCSESGTVSDMLKLELKTKIQLRRLKKGKDLHFEEKPTQIEYRVSCSTVKLLILMIFFSFVFYFHFAKDAI